MRKDGLILIREMAAEVKNLMDFKMGAVMVSTFLYVFDHLKSFKNLSRKLLN